MGSVHSIIPAVRLRPYLVDAVQRGIQRYLDKKNGNATNVSDEHGNDKRNGNLSTDGGK
jgi:hypothetical protein